MKKTVKATVTDTFEDYCEAVSPKEYGGMDVYYRIPFPAKKGDIVIITYELDNS